MQFYAMDCKNIFFWKSLESSSETQRNVFAQLEVLVALICTSENFSFWNAVQIL